MIYQILTVGILFQLIYYQPFGQWLFQAIPNKRKQQNFLVIFQRVAVIVLFLSAGYIALPNHPDHSWLELPNNPWFYLLSMISCLAVFMVTNRYLKKREDFLKNMHLDFALDSKFYFLLNILTWTFYLTVYEYYLRGILLEYLLVNFDLAIAFSLNVLFYAFLHLQKSKGEIIGSIPFGFYLCWITYASGSIVPAVIIHISLALSHDLLAVYMYKQSKAKDI